jgi:pyridoxamine 5'-phosphate oxidase
MSEHSDAGSPREPGQSSSDLAGMRRGYGDVPGGILDEHTVAPTWHQQMRAWFDDAVATFGERLIELNAMQVATVDAQGHPAVRTVLLKDLDERGIAFYTNYESDKGRELAATPYASAVIYWGPLERQVRLTGPVTRVDRAEGDVYFASRPRGSQISAWASPQSSVIESRAILEDAVRSLERRYEGADVPTPPHWGGLRIAPRSVEFWQGRADRLHDRIRYRLDAGTWVVERLAP